jgi:hypothetical protein
LSDAIFIKEKKMEWDNKVTQFENPPHKFKTITWKDILKYFIREIIETVGIALGG